MVENIKNLLTFLQGVNREFSKVVWPSKSELIGMTSVVLLLVLFFSLYIGAIDFIFNRLAAWIF